MKQMCEYMREYKGILIKSQIVLWCVYVAKKVYFHVHKIHVLF